MSNFLQPMDCSPPGSSVHGDSPSKTTRVDCHALLQRIFPTQGLNLLMPPALQVGPLPLAPPGTLPRSCIKVFQSLSKNKLVSMKVNRMGNGNPLLCSCLENWGAWQATVHGPKRARLSSEQWRLSRVFLLPLWGQCHTSAWKTRTQWVQRAPHDFDAYSFSVVSLQIKKASCSKKWKGFKLQREFWVMRSWAGGALEIWANSIPKYLTSSSINWNLWIDVNSDYPPQPHPHSWDSTGI